MLNRSIKHLYLPLLAVLVALLSSPLYAQESENIKVAKALSNAYAEIAAVSKPTVVALRTVKEVNLEESMPQLPPNAPDQLKEFFKQFRGDDSAPHSQKAQGMGSGVIIDAKGTIITNNHVIDDATEIEVVLEDGTKLQGEIVGADPKTDLAIVKISNPDNQKFKFAPLGDSAKMRVGNIVIAIGAPFGLEQSVTAGIISATNRSQLGGRLSEIVYKDFFQTDATINMGNSGGPLFNLDGEVIGINSAISSASGGSDGVGFSIPINMAKEIITELEDTGSVTRGYLGVAIRDFTPEMGEAISGVDSGVLVMQPYPGTPAYNGGMQMGDIMLDYNGTPLKSAQQLQNLVAHTKVGTTVDITVLRGGAKKNLKITIAKQPKKMGMPEEKEEQKAKSPTASEYTSYKLGLTVVPLSQATPEEQEAYKGMNGVLIRKVAFGSEAFDKGLAAGILIKLVNQNIVENITDFKSIDKNLAYDKPVLLQFFIGKNPGVLTLKTNSEEEAEVLKKADAKEQAKADK